jgi:hypothetical protein
MKEFLLKLKFKLTPTQYFLVTLCKRVPDTGTYEYSTYSFAVKTRGKYLYADLINTISKDLHIESDSFAIVNLTKI